MGFLGAGKTTFLRNLLPRLEKSGLEPFVIINDYENARIDASSLAALVKEVTPINGNCVCCDSIHELINTMLDMPARPNRVVLIEANGTTDPFSLIEHLSAHAELRSRFFPLIQVGVVDVKRWQKRFWHNDLERMQAETASHLNFTRVESEKDARVCEVKSDLDWMNPRAVETTPESLAQELQKLATGPRGEPRFWVAKAQGDSPSQSHSGHHLAHGFVAVQLQLPETVHGPSFYEWLRQIPGEVLRIKGIVQMEELPDMHFIFQRTDEAPRQPTLFPLPTDPVMPPCAVLIGVRLDETKLRQQMERMLQ